MNQLLRLLQMGRATTPVVDPPAADGWEAYDVVNPTATFLPDFNMEQDRYIGANIPTPVDWTEECMFTNMCRGVRPPLDTDFRNYVPLDATGWPTADFTLLLNLSSPPQDSMVGQFTGSCTGQIGTLKLGPSNGATVVFDYNNYDSATNKTTFAFTQSSTTMTQLVLSFTGTKRLPSDTAGNGITDLVVKRPADAGWDGTFSQAYLDSLKYYTHLRFMDFNNTNGQDIDDDTVKYTTWANRPTRDTIHFSWSGDGAVGHANYTGVLEDQIELCNLSHCDMWWNCPHNCSVDFVENAAKLIRDTLDPTLKVYVEYSNERWNFAYGFGQYFWFGRKADDEIQAANDAGGDPSIFGTTVEPAGSGRDRLGWFWSARQAKRVAEVFKATFTGTHAPRLRNILGLWLTTSEYSGYSAQALIWLNQHFGFPGYTFFATAGARYDGFGTIAASDSTWMNTQHTLDEYAQRLYDEQSSRQGSHGAEGMQTLAARFGMNYVGYENGWDFTNLPNGSWTHNLSNHATTKDSTKLFLTDVLCSGTGMLTWYQHHYVGTPSQSSSFDMGNTFNDYDNQPISTAFRELKAAGRPAMWDRNRIASDGSATVIDGRNFVGGNKKQQPLPAPSSTDYANPNPDGFKTVDDGGWYGGWKSTMPFMLTHCVAGTYELSMKLAAATTYDSPGRQAGYSVNFGPATTVPDIIPNDGHEHTLGPYQIQLREGVNWLMVGDGSWAGWTQVNGITLRKIG